jgi:hypothetical protein
VEWSSSRGSPPRVGRLYGYWQLPGASGSPARANSSAVTLARPRRPCSGSFRCGLPVSTPPRPETGRLAAAQFANAPVSGWMTPALGRPRQPRQGGTAPCRRTSSSTTSRPGGCRAPTAARGPHGQASLPASATASSIPPSRSWTGPRSVRSAPPPSWLVDAASLEEAVTLAKGCRVSRRRWCPGWRARPASASPGARICGSSKTPSSVTSVYSMLRLGPAIAGAIVREGHLDPSQVARPAVLLVRTDECPLGISRGRTRGTTRPPNPGNSES